MTASIARKLCTLLLPVSFCLGWSASALAQAAAPADGGATKTPAPEAEQLPPYHHSIFSWEHSVTAATLGVGETPQSANPTYIMGLLARLRYYLVDNTPKGEHFSLRLDGGLYREFTNSDVTTQRGEWSFSDTDLAAAYARRVHGASDSDGVLAELRPLTLTLPTSKLSFDSGRYFAAGVLVGVNHATPLFRGRAADISSLVRLAVGYKRWFSRATVPTNPSFERLRLAPDGRSLPSDELAGSSLTRDELTFSARWRLELSKDLLWTTDAAFSPAWKYDIQKDVPVCGVILTGCTDVQVSPDDSRYLVRTQFSSEFSLRVAKSLSVELGYGNTANQLGRDGRRRNFFYSPEAVFYASVSFFPHELATSSKQLAESQTTPKL